jgi:hypothetical protein
MGPMISSTQPESHLRELLREFVAHYHVERNHQGLGNEPSGMTFDKHSSRTERTKRSANALPHRVFERQLSDDRARSPAPAHRRHAQLLPPRAR